MAKAQVLVTLTAEALVEVPSDVDDVQAYCRDHLGLTWGALQVDTVVQPPTITVEHYMIPEPAPAPEPEPEPEPVPEPEPEPEPALQLEPEPEPEPEPVLVEPAMLVEVPIEAAEPEAVPVVETIHEDTQPLPAYFAAGPESRSIVELFDDPAYRNVIRSAVRERAERLLEDVVNQVVTELEPLLQRHLDRNVRGAQ